MLCQFLLCTEVDQLYVYVGPLPLESPSRPSSPPHLSMSSQSTKLSPLCAGFTSAQSGPRTLRLKEKEHQMKHDPYVSQGLQKKQS